MGTAGNAGRYGRRERLIIRPAPPAPGYDGPMDAIARRMLVLAALGFAVALAWLGPMDASASAHAEAGLKRALATFAAARALNAAISVAKGTELSVAPAGLGVTLTPGQVLDPVDDLVEQFSSLMLLASVAFGVEIALIRMGAHWLVAAALSAIALAWAWRAWRGRPRLAWLDRLVVAALLVRFAVPLVVLGSEAGFRLFLAGDYAAGQAAIESSGREIDARAAPPAAPKGEEGIADRLKGWWSRAPDVGQKIDELKAVAGRAVEHVVRLIVVFLLQTLVVPLLLLWALVRLGRGLAAPGGGAGARP
jgi:hypothetical protein